MKKGKIRRLTKSIISFVMAVVLFIAAMPPVSVKAATEFKWLGQDGKAKVETGLGNGGEYAGKWFIADDKNDGGNSRVELDAPCGTDPYWPVTDAHVLQYQGISGKAILDQGSLDYLPGVYIGFYVVGGTAEEPVAGDVTDWGGLSISYECDKAARLELWMENSENAKVGFDIPGCYLKAAPEGNVMSIPWSAFTREGWGNGSITTAEAVTKLASVRFRIKGNDGEYNFKIKGIGSLNALTVPTKYNVNFDMGGYGIEVIEAQLVEEGSKASIPPTPHEITKSFGGWYADSGFNIPFNFEAPIMANTTIYAKWNDKSEPEVYSVNFNSNGGSIVAAQNIASGAKASEPAVPTKEGCTFAGWYADSALTVPFDFNTLITANTVIYAKWNISSYIIKFNSNGGSAVADQPVAIGGKATKPADPTRAGYTFGGWYADSALTVPFDFNAVITASATVYAKWFEGDAPTIYTVSFETNGGTAIAAQHIVSGQKAARPADPSKVGSVFGGWYSDSALTTAFSFDTPITADMVIYAKWNPVKTSVTLSSNSLTLRMGESIKLEATVTPDNAADKSLSWSSANEGIAKVDANGTVTALKPGETTITATCNSGGEKAECKVTVERKSLGDDELTTRISDMDIDKYVVPSSKTVSVNFTAKLSKTETAEGTIVFNYLDAISYTGKKISPDMLKPADAELINLAGVLKAAGIRETVKADDVLGVKYTSAKNKDAGEAKFYAKLSVKKAAKNYLNKDEITKLKKVVAAANKELKKKDKRIKYTINPASLADMSNVYIIAKAKGDGSFFIKEGKLAKIKSVSVKYKATDEKAVKIPAKMYFTSNAREDGTVKINGKKNFTGCVTVKATAQ